MSLPAGTDLHARLRIAHANTACPGWTAELGARRLMIAIRDASGEGTAEAASAGDRIVPGCHDGLTGFIPSAP